MSVFEFIFVVFIIIIDNGVISQLTEWNLVTNPSLPSYLMWTMFGTGYDIQNELIWFIGGYNKDIIAYFSINNSSFHFYSILPTQIALESQGYAQYYDVIYFEVNNHLHSFNMTSKNVTTNIVQLHPDGDPNGKMFIPCLASDNKYIYILGGASDYDFVNWQITSNTQSRGLFYYYDPISNMIIPGPDMRQGTFRHSCGIVKGYLYSFGGLNPKETSLGTMQRIYIGNAPSFQGIQWETLSDTMGGNRVWSKAVTMNDQIYIIGGRSGLNDWNNLANIVDTVRVFDPDSQLVTLDIASQIKRSNPSIIGIKNKIYVFGGQGDTFISGSFEISNPFPTNVPSNSPTVSTSPPTVNPSNAPSVSPTNTPSNIPTEYPSMNPTETPTDSPSNIPTLIPTENPTVTRNPTNTPTLTSDNPTSIPSRTPSTSPSTAPTIPPTSIPSDFPSYSPSIYPSKSPSISPSISPSVFPSISPASNILTETPTTSPEFNDKSQIIQTSTVIIIILGSVIVFIIAAILIGIAFCKRNRKLQERYEHNVFIQSKTYPIYNYTI